MTMSKEPTHPRRVVTGDAEQVTVEALGDLRLVTAGISNLMRGNLKQAAEGVADAFEE